MTTTNLDQSPYRPGVYGSGQCRGAAEMTALAAVRGVWCPPPERQKSASVALSPKTGPLSTLCPACLREPPTGVGTLVFLGARCRAVRRVARAHGIDGG